MTIKAISTTLTGDWYIPKSEREEETPTRFYLKPLDGPTGTIVMAELNADFRLSAKGIVTALVKCLTNWENFQDSTGGQIPFSRANMDRIPIAIKNELAEFLLEQAMVTDEDKKNSL